MRNIELFLSIEPANHIFAGIACIGLSVFNIIMYAWFKTWEFEQSSFGFGDIILILIESCLLLLGILLVFFG